MIQAKPWKNESPPRRILAIRMQATGDVVITLPYLQSLRNNLPANTQLDLLTREETDPIPKSLELFNNIYSIGGERSYKKQIVLTCLILPKLILQKYDAVLDLQNHSLSNTIRKILRPRAWSVFDKQSTFPAGERTRMTIEAAGLTNISISPNFKFKNPEAGIPILKKHGWDGSAPLVILNPAAAFITRNWPVENYIMFSKLWLNDFPLTKFLLLGTSFISDKAKFIQAKLGDACINLVEYTTVAEAFNILQKASFVLSEDSGLMHMSWISGIKTFALFGGSRSDWAQPLGKNSFFIDSTDLPCGSCMRETCKYGDTHCLTRFTPEYVYELSLKLYKKSY